MKRVLFVLKLIGQKVKVHNLALKNLEEKHFCIQISHNISNISRIKKYPHQIINLSLNNMIKF